MFIYSKCDDLSSAHLNFLTRTFNCTPFGPNPAARPGVFPQTRRTSRPFRVIIPDFQFGFLAACDCTPSHALCRYPEGLAALNGGDSNQSIPHTGLNAFYPLTRLLQENSLPICEKMTRVSVAFRSEL